MPNPDTTNSPRSFELLSPHDSALLVVDLQDRLLSLIAERETLIWNAERLIEAAGILQVPVLSTVQNPDKLGPMTARIGSRLTEPAAKMDFSCGAHPDLFRPLADRGIMKIVVVGAESHVCILQTALDLLAVGFRVYLPVDAIGARHRLDHEIALRRLDSAGATLATTEMVMFEWCQRAGNEPFRQISAIVKRTAPPSSSL